MADEPRPRAGDPMAEMCDECGERPRVYVAAGPFILPGRYCSDECRDVVQVRSALMGDDDDDIIRRRRRKR